MASWPWGIALVPNSASVKEVWNVIKKLLGSKEPKICAKFCDKSNEAKPEPKGASNSVRFIGLPSKVMGFEERPGTITSRLIGGFWIPQIVYMAWAV